MASWNCSRVAGKKLALVDRLRQATKGIAVAHEIRPHGDDNVGGKLRLLAVADSEVDEGDCLIAFIVDCQASTGGLAQLLTVAEAENLLELIDQQQIPFIALGSVPVRQWYQSAPVDCGAGPLR